MLVTGSTGFIGSAVTHVLSQRRDVDIVWALRSPVEKRAGPGRVVRIDMTDSSSLRGIANRVDVVIHLAHLISGPSELLRAVNDRGARVLASEAGESGARLVAVSTAAVYGAGPWHGVDIHDLVEAPTSPVSATRADGDRHILDAGGAVVRPHLVLGRGDRWVIPRAAAIVAEFGWPAIGNALHSVISVETLATQLVDLALAPHPPTGVCGAYDPEPRLLSPMIAHRMRLDGLRPASTATDPALATASAPIEQRKRLWHDLRFISTTHHLTCSCRAISPRCTISAP